MKSITCYFSETGVRRNKAVIYQTGAGMQIFPAKFHLDSVNNHCRNPSEIKREARTDGLEWGKNKLSGRNDMQNSNKLTSKSGVEKPWGYCCKTLSSGVAVSVSMNSSCRINRWNTLKLEFTPSKMWQFYQGGSEKFVMDAMKWGGGSAEELTLGKKLMRGELAVSSRKEGWWSPIFFFLLLALLHFRVTESSSSASATPHFFLLSPPLFLLKHSWLYRSWSSSSSSSCRWGGPEDASETIDKSSSSSSAPFSSRNGGSLWEASIECSKYRVQPDSHPLLHSETNMFILSLSKDSAMEVSLWSLSLVVRHMTPFHASRYINI